MKLIERAEVYAALGDPHRLRMVDALRTSDRTFSQLARIAGLPGNAAAHHVGVLESVGLLERRQSEGDRRRRYLTLRGEVLDALAQASPGRLPVVLFVCTHNSARSQFAAAAWQRRGGVAESAGLRPASAVHPTAIEVAAEYGIDLAKASPRGYEAVEASPDLVISVCDRANEAPLPFDAPAVHWSIPDPVLVGSAEAFRRAFGEIDTRVERLATTDTAPAEQALTA